jgi:hypothetical protein
MVMLSCLSLERPLDVIMSPRAMSRSSARLEMVDWEYPGSSWDSISWSYAWLTTESLKDSPAFRPRSCRQKEDYHELSTPGSAACPSTMMTCLLRLQRKAYTPFSS